VIRIGVLHREPLRVNCGRDTMLSRIVWMFPEAQHSSVPIQRLAIRLPG
jgi:cation transport ATPase